MYRISIAFDFALCGFVYSLIKDSDEYYKQAQQAKSELDDERRFANLYEYITIILCIQKRSEYKKEKKFYDALMGSARIQASLEDLERLKDALDERYGVCVCAYF